MFESLKREDPRSGVRCLASLLISLVIHAAIACVVVVLPLVFFNVLHADELVTFLIQPPYRLPDAPTPPAPPVRTAAAGIAVVTERFDPVPRKLPVGIPAPDLDEAPPISGSLVDGISLPGQAPMAGRGIDELLDKHPIAELTKPKPPTVHIPVRVGGDVQQSKLVFKVPPVYPPLAIQAHVSGTVVLEAEIDEEGNVADVEVISGHPFLVPAAAEAVRRWKYSPTLLNGEPQRVLAVVTVVFRLQ